MRLWPECPVWCQPNPPLEDGPAQITAVKCQRPMFHRGGHLWMRFTNGMLQQAFRWPRPRTPTS
jgi:hypothetical protein